MKLPRFRSDRSASTAVLIGLAAPAMIAMVGLSIDFAGVLAARTKLELGADSAALVAVMTAINAVPTDPTNYIGDGVVAGQARFKAQTGTLSMVSAPAATVSVVQKGLILTGTATWSGTYNTLFGTLFGVPSWSLAGVAKVNSQISAPFLNIEIMLDNSPSMEIGATNSDIQTLQALTPCSASGATIPNPDGSWSSPASGQSYSAYQCNSGNSYDGGLACPINQPSPPYQSPITFNPSQNPPPSCAGLLPAQTIGPLAGQYPQAGAPCAFACHFDTSKPSGAGNDYYGVARSTIGTGTPVTLRFDVVKSAVNTLISSMQTNDLPIKNLKAGVFTFADALTQIYPASGEAGDDWATITGLVGGPPTVANGPDTGIQPYSGNNGGDTDIPDTMSTLAGQLSPSGDGTTAATARKVLFLVTDGVVDYNDAQGNRTLAAIDPVASCKPFKDMGYAIYVVYTPYYPLMNGYYLSNMFNLVEAGGGDSITTNLQACASSPSNFIQASDSASLTAALQTFFSLATNPPAHFSK